MKAFDFSSPRTVAEAVALIADGAQPLAGGTDLIVQLREGRRAVGHVVDMKRIPALTARESPRPVAADAMPRIFPGVLRSSASACIAS